MNIMVDRIYAASEPTAVLCAQDLTGQHNDDMLDHALMDTFPASDPVSSNIFN